MEHLVKFWLEAESFHSTTWSRIRAHSLNTVKQSSLAEPVSPSKKPETTSASFVTESLDRRLGDSSSAPLLVTPPEGTDLSGRTQNTQDHLLLSQECHSAPALHLEMARTGAPQISTDSRESSPRLTVASRNSPSSPLRELSGKLMKSKYVTPVPRHSAGLQTRRTGQHRIFLPQFTAVGGLGGAREPLWKWVLSGDSAAGHCAVYLHICPSRWSPSGLSSHLSLSNCTL